MDRERLDHVLRLLRQAPARALPADVLLQRLRCDLGIELDLLRLLGDLASAPERFAVLPALAGGGTGWSPVERADYAGATAGLGLSLAPVIMLRPDAPAFDDGGDEVPGQDPPGGVGGLLEDLHAGLAVLLAATADHAGVRAAVGSALAELEAARRQGVRG